MHRADHNKQNEVGNHYVAYMRQQVKILKNFINLAVSTDAISTEGPSNKKRPAKPRRSKALPDILESDEDKPSSSHSFHRLPRKSLLKYYGKNKKVTNVVHSNNNVEDPKVSLEHQKENQKNLLNAEVLPDVTKTAESNDGNLSGKRAKSQHFVEENVPCSSYGPHRLLKENPSLVMLKNICPEECHVIKSTTQKKTGKKKHIWTVISKTIPDKTTEKPK